jgi:hypothetical protein
VKKLESTCYLKTSYPAKISSIGRALILHLALDIDLTGGPKNKKDDTYVTKHASTACGSPPWPRRSTRLPTAIRKGRLRGWFACSTTASARADVRLGAYGTASAQLSARKLDSLIGRLIKLNWIGRCFCSQMVVVVRGAGVANSAISVLLGLGLLRWFSLAPG